MPNPITKVRPSVNAIFTPGAIVEHRPATALAMVNVLTYWPVLEGLIGTTLIDVLGVKAKGIIEEFIQRATSSQQRQLLQKHADPVLTADLREYLEVLLSMFTSDYKERIRLVHWRSGFSPDVPEAILLQNPIRSWRDSIGGHEYREAQERAFAGPIADRPLALLSIDPPHPNLEYILVYTEEDFRRMTENVQELTRGFTLFSWIQHTPLQFERDRKYSQLSALPRFLPTLTRLRAKKQRENRPRAESGTPHRLPPT